MCGVTKYQLVPFSYDKSRVKFQPLRASPKREPILIIFFGELPLWAVTRKLITFFEFQKFVFRQEPYRKIPYHARKNLS